MHLHYMKLFYQRQSLREQLHKSQIQLQKQQSRKSYYWEEFLNLIEILREFNALEGYHPTELGKAAATIRGENELWLGLALMSGQLDHLEPLSVDTKTRPAWEYVSPVSIALPRQHSPAIDLRHFH